MKKIINNITIFFVLTALAVLASCGNTSLSKNNYDDGKIYLSFNVNKDNLNTVRSVYNPSQFTEDDVTAVRLYCKENGNDLTRYDKLNVGLLQEWLFVAKDGKNAIEVFTDSVIEFKYPMFTKKDSSKKNDNYYDFIIELCTDDLKYETSDYIYYTPIQIGTKQKVLVVPGLNTLSFTTENYRINGWTDYYSLIDFEYKSKSGEGVGYIEAVLKTYPYNEGQWFGIWDIIERKEVDPWFERRWGAEAKEGIVTLTSDNILFEDEHKTKFPYIETDRCNPNYVKNGEYTLELTLYDAKGGNVLRRTSDVIYLHGYKTKVVSKELSVNSGAVDLYYGNKLSIEDSWNLCTNHGTISISDTKPLAKDETERVYSVQLKFNDVVIAETGENGKLSVDNLVISWNQELFEGKTSQNGVYACKLIVNDKTFDLNVPDRKYYSYAVNGRNPLDPVNPGELATVEGNIFIHFEGEGQEQYCDTQTWNRTFYTVRDYSSKLLSYMSENAHVFIDLSDVTGITQVLREDVELTDTGAWLEGIAFPDSATKIDTGTFMCPLKQTDDADNRYYELTVVLGSAANDVYALVDASDNRQYAEYVEEEQQDGTIQVVLNSHRRNLYNPFKKFIVSKNNNQLVTYQDGALLGNMTGTEHVDLIASADVIEELEIPFTINAIERNAFAGNRKLKKIVEWGITDVIRDDAFNTSGLEGDVELGVRLALICTRAFANTKITSLTFDDAMRVFYNEIVPDGVYIGYKPGSNKVQKWAWVTKTIYENDLCQDIWGIYNGWYSGMSLPDNPSGAAKIMDWEEFDNYKYANYLGNTDFKDHYFWYVD